MLIPLTLSSWFLISEAVYEGTQMIPNLGAQIYLWLGSSALSSLLYFTHWQQYKNRRHYLICAGLNPLNSIRRAPFFIIVIGSSSSKVFFCNKQQRWVQQVVAHLSSAFFAVASVCESALLFPRTESNYITENTILYQKRSKKIAEQLLLLMSSTALVVILPKLFHVADRKLFSRHHHHHHHIDWIRHVIFL